MKILDFDDAAVLWELDFPSKPDGLKSVVQTIVLTNSSHETTGEEKENGQLANRSIASFLRRNHFDAIRYDGKLIQLKNILCNVRGCKLFVGHSGIHSDLG